MKSTPLPAIHFPTAREHGPFPFPTSPPETEARQPGDNDQLSAEELRPIADTMPGDGPGD
jgi:hypothetical protein